jgi:hypothetical protein
VCRQQHHAAITTKLFSGLIAFGGPGGQDCSPCGEPPVRIQELDAYIKSMCFCYLTVRDCVCYSGVVFATYVAVMLLRDCVCYLCGGYATQGCVCTSTLVVLLRDCVCRIRRLCYSGNVYATYLPIMLCDYVMQRLEWN